MWCHIERSRIRACPFLQVYQWSHSRHSSHPSVRECGGRGTHRTKPDNIPDGELPGERKLDIVREAVHDFLDAWMLGCLEGEEHSPTTGDLDEFIWALSAAGDRGRSQRSQTCGFQTGTRPSLSLFWMVCHPSR